MPYRIEDKEVNMAGTKTFSVVIVDDNPIYSNWLKSYLSKSPFFSVETFSAGKDLLENLSHQPDLVVWDLELNHASDLEQAWLKTVQEQMPDLPVLIFSHTKTPVTSRLVKKLGVKGFISKGPEGLRNVYEFIRSSLVV